MHSMSSVQCPPVLCMPCMILCIRASAECREEAPQGTPHTHTHTHKNTYTNTNTNTNLTTHSHTQHQGHVFTVARPGKATC
mmetsp:Transcript_16922/g.46767  ORF Transcript_16922/g.46767 Transcript_16922/m.46767 type:complete len:81 (+) Transcript_16922:850-1092(+)